MNTVINIPFVTIVCLIIIVIAAFIAYRKKNNLLLTFLGILAAVIIALPGLIGLSAGPSKPSKAEDVFEKVKNGTYSSSDLDYLISYFTDNIDILKENQRNEKDPQHALEWYIAPGYKYSDCSNIEEMKANIIGVINSHIKYGSVFELGTGYQDGEPTVIIWTFNEKNPPWE